MERGSAGAGLTHLSAHDVRFCRLLLVGGWPRIAARRALAWLGRPGAMSKRAHSPAHRAGKYLDQPDGGR